MFKMGTSLRSLMPRNQKALYEQNPSVGCYVYYLQYVNNPTERMSLQQQITFGDGSITVNVGIARPNWKLLGIKGMSSSLPSPPEIFSMEGASIWLWPPQQDLHQSLHFVEALIIMSSCYPSSHKGQDALKGKWFFYTHILVTNYFNF